jgi:error-prone DNA polymerase
MAPSLDFPYHEWACKTYFSFLNGASSPEQLLQRAMRLGYQSLCINDYDGVYGLARIFKQRNQLESSGTGKLALHYAAEIHLTPDHDKPLLNQNTIILLARSAKGYFQLCTILTLAHRERKNHAYICLESLIQQNLSELSCLVPMRGLIRNHLQSEYYPILNQAFCGHFYLLVSRHLHPMEDQWIQPTLVQAKRNSYKTLIAQDAFFHHPSQKIISDLLQTIKNNNLIDQNQAYFFPNSERHLHRLTTIKRLYIPLPIYQQACSNSFTLAESIDFCLSQLGYQYPKEMLPPGQNAQSYLEYLTWKNAPKRLGTPIPEKWQALVKKELLLIKELGFADYFLTVWDIVSWAKGQDILCQGRGSAANSCVCFILGITAAGPQHFDPLFERFISKERGDPPDIDVDFEHERREEVIQYVYQRYGRSRAAMVANCITFKKRGALRAVGKALGFPEKVLELSAKGLRSRYRPGKTMADYIQYIKDQSQELISNEQMESLPWSLWPVLSEQIIGFPRHLGIHSGGFMLADKPLNHLVAQEPATMEGRTVIQWSKEDIEGLQFFKIDLLCLGMLSALKKCFLDIQALYGQSIDLHSVPNDDRPTYEMIQKADTVGVFQIESRAQMSMLPRLKPSCFYDLVIEIAIIRPGPIQGKVIHPYLLRRQRKVPITYAHPELQPILEKTLGVAIFQEQVMKIAMTIGDFTAGEANELRRHIGAWNIKDFERDLAPWLEKLERGMQQKKIPKDFIHQMMEQLKGFANYGFPESHAVSFAFIAYVSSYIKCHYPAIFFRSILNSLPMGFYSPHALIQAAKRAQVPIFPISVLHSEWDHSLEKEGQQWGIRLGMRLVNELTRQGSEQLLMSRKSLGPWNNFQDFLKVNPLNRSDFTALAAANAFAPLGINSIQALWIAEAIPEIHLGDLVEPLFQLEDTSPIDQIKRDFMAFNTTLGPHPTEIVKNKYWPFSIQKDLISTSIDLNNNTNIGCPIDTFGIVLIKQAPSTAKGMVFITLEDAFGHINLALGPPTYQRYRKEIEGHLFLCIHGQLQLAGTYRSILVKKIYSQSPQQKIGQKNGIKKRLPPAQPTQQEFTLHFTPRQFH